MRTRMTRTAGAVLAGVLLLAGCSGEEEPAVVEVPDGAEMPESTTSTPAPGVDVIEVGELQNPSIALASAGLLLLEDGQLADGMEFSTPDEDVLFVMELVTGEQPEFTPVEDCGSGVEEQLTYANGLQLNFTQGAFTGWFVDDRAGDAVPQTVAGLGLGTSFVEFREAIPSAQVLDGSTIGTEFFSDAGYSGLLDGPAESGRITALWAGDVCIFR